MISDILFDFSRVLLFPKDKNYTGKLNDLYRQIVTQPQYNFFDYFELNTELIDFIKTLRSLYKIHIFTSEIIQTDPALKRILKENFNQVFSAADFGIDKKHTEIYTAIAQKLGRIPAQLLFIDDNSGNIRAASLAGLSTIEYISNENLFSKLSTLLNK